MSSDKNRPEKKDRCPSCGSGFKCCFGGLFCWCATVKVSRQARAEIGKRYSGCLCKDCLTAFASGDLPESPVPNDN